MGRIGITNYSDFENSLIGKELKSYKEIRDFQEYFDDIAKYIFGHVAIVIGESNSKQITYYLGEIEFYYNNGKIPEDEITFTKDKKEKKEKKNFFSCTYKREKAAKQLFWHYSGVDICFQSDETCYGGILIRSLTKEYIGKNGKIARELITGPLRCANEIMNQCVEKGGNSVPKVEEVTRYVNHNEIRSTIRQGIESSDKYDVLRAKIRKDSDGYVVSDDFPCFCYYTVKGKDGWKTIVDNKTIRYNANPEKRKGIIRKVP